MPFALAPVLDFVVVLVFAAVGRRNHGEADALTGILTTAWPFLVGALIGWIIVWLWRRGLTDGSRLDVGAVVWLSTVAFGMVLRHLSGRGVQFSFVVVALIFNGLCMIGWRAVATMVTRRRARRA